MQLCEKIHEDAFHINAHMVKRYAAVRPEGNNSLKQLFHKICTGNAIIFDTNQPVFNAEFTASSFQFAHKKIFACKQKDARLATRETGAGGTTPEVEAGAGYKFFLQGAVIGTVKPQIKGQGHRQQAQSTVAHLPAGQLSQGFIRFFCEDQVNTLTFFSRQACKNPTDLLQFLLFFHYSHRPGAALQQKAQGVSDAATEKNRKGTV